MEQKGEYHKSVDELEAELLLIAAAQERPERFQPLYVAYYKPIFLFVFKRTGDENITEDIVSSVFLKALLNIGKFKFKGVPFSAWLYRIALNELNLFFRTAKRKRWISLDKNMLHLLASEASIEEKRYSENDVLACLTKLPTDALELIELRFFENLPFAEIAKILEITENNAKVKVYRILEQLRKMLTNQRSGIKKKY